MPYHKLTTEKYWQASVRQQDQAARAQKNREAIRGFFQLAMVFLVFVATLLAVLKMPIWMPMVVDFLQGFGINLGPMV